MVNKEEAEAWYKELYKLMWAMVWDYANNDRWVLDADELFAELSAELVKVVYRYDGGEYTHRELKGILIVSLRNRCNDMVTMAYKTHRKAESDMLSLDVDDDDIDGGCIVAKGVGVVDHYFDLDGLLQELSDDGQSLVFEVLDPSERTYRFLDLFCARKEATSPKNHWKLEITPLIMCRIMGWDRERLDNAWKEVGCALEYI